MSHESIQRGLAAHYAIAQRLIERGYEVLQPVDESLRYDLAYYDPGESVFFGFFKHREPKLQRIQCKTGRLSKDESMLLFNAFNNSGRKLIKRGYQGEVEYFGIYCAELRKVYLVPVDDIPYAGEVHLRLKKSRNNQEQGVRWAKDYEI